MVDENNKTHKVSIWREALLKYAVRPYAPLTDAEEDQLLQDQNEDTLNQEAQINPSEPVGELDNPDEAQDTEVAVLEGLRDLQES